MDSLTLIIIFEMLLLAGVIGPMHYGATMVRSGQFQKALPVLRAYYAASKFLPRWRGPIAGFVSACYVGMGEFALAQPYAEEAVAESARYQYAQHLASARAHLGIILVHLGDFEQAEPLIQQTLRAEVPPRLRTTVDLFAANGFINLDRLEEADRLIQNVLSNPKAGADVQIVALANLSLCRLYQERTEEALEAAQRAAKAKAPTPAFRFAVLRGLLVCLTELGRLSEAEEIAAQIAPQLNSLDAFRQGAALRALAELALKKGELDRARDYAQRSATLGINPNAHANTLLIQAEVFAARHNTHRALTLCRDILETRSVRFYKARAEALIARLEAAEAGTDLANPDTLANSPANLYTTSTQPAEQKHEAKI